MSDPQLPPPRDVPGPPTSPNALAPEPATGPADPHHHHIENISDHVKPRMASSVLLWTVLGAVVAFFIWAYFAELDRTVRGQGRVVPSSRLQVISNLEGGIVEAILVRTGQDVKRGAELVRLDSTQSTSELGSSQSAYDALTAKVARLEAEVEGREPRFPASPNPAVQEQVAIERSLHISRMADLSSQTLAAQSRLIQAQRSVAEARATLGARISAREAAKSELALIRPLVEKGIEPRLSLVQSENQAAVSAGEAAAAAATVTRAQASVAEAQAQLAQARQDWRAQAAGELATAQAEMATRRQALPAYSDKVRRTVIRAPLDGRVNRVLVTTIGGSVRAGDPIVEIVPSQETLVVDTLVLAKDIAFVRMDQPAKIELTAYESAIYGSLKGKVTSISPDAVVDERTGESRYTVRVQTDGKLLHDRLGRELPIGAGMVATVSLLGDKRSVLNYILTPITRLQQTAFRE
jgi:adhesin transport system membrane fusion protein